MKNGEMKYEANVSATQQKTEKQTRFSGKNANQKWPKTDFPKAGKRQKKINRK